ncbi:hypothetical protein [Ammoniphilus sp. 3BR4]|uniref:hypothetical protein n=1 Tax=Ammoniphilus sp. 3BR4 TaxID=3158265 RepID=UPI003467B7DB
MAKRQNRASKADVQSTQLNRFSTAGEADTEFSAEEAANVFEQNQANGAADQNQQQQ